MEINTNVVINKLLEKIAACELEIAILKTRLDDEVQKEKQEKDEI